MEINRGRRGGSARQEKLQDKVFSSAFAWLQYTEKQTLAITDTGGKYPESHVPEGFCLSPRKPEKHDGEKRFCDNYGSSLSGLAHGTPMAYSVTSKS